MNRGCNLWSVWPEVSDRGSQVQISSPRGSRQVKSKQPWNQVGKPRAGSQFKPGAEQDPRQKVPGTYCVRMCHPWLVAERSLHVLAEWLHTLWPVWNKNSRSPWWKTENFKTARAGTVFFFFSMCTIFKTFIEFVTILLLFYVFVFWPWGMWDLGSPAGIKPAPTALEGQVLTTGPLQGPSDGGSRATLQVARLWSWSWGQVWWGRKAVSSWLCVLQRKLVSPQWSCLCWMKQPRECWLKPSWCYKSFILAAKSTLGVGRPCHMVQNNQ